MSLTKTWAPFFQSHIRMRGRSYQLAGRVTQITPLNGEFLRAAVQGKENYTVIIQGDDQSATGYCTCPAFKAGQYCKHIWAALLDVQSNGTRYPTAGMPNLTPDITPRLPKAKERDIIRQSATPREQGWIDHLSALRKSSLIPETVTIPSLPTQAAICYVINTSLSSRYNSLVLELKQYIPNSTSWLKLKPIKLSNNAIRLMADKVDRELCSIMLGSTPIYEDSDRYRSHRSEISSLLRINPGAQRTLLKRMIGTQRCYINTSNTSYNDSGTTGQLMPSQLIWDSGSPWSPWVFGTKTNTDLIVTIQLRRDTQTIPINEPTLILGGAQGIIIHHNTVAAFDDGNAFRWITHFRDEIHTSGQTPEIHVPNDEISGFLDRLYMMPQLPEIDFPKDIGRTEKHVDPVPHIDITTQNTDAQTMLSNGNRSTISAQVWFAYERARIAPTTPGRFAPQIPGTHDAQIVGNNQNNVTSDKPETTNDDHYTLAKLVRRDHHKERSAISQLLELGFRTANADNPDLFLLPTRNMPTIINQLIQNGWVVKADEKALHTPSVPPLSITSGIDWFQLRGNIKYQTQHGQQTISLPDILKAARAGKNMIALDDGSQGMLPQEWLDQHRLLSNIATLEDDHLRFSANQAAILDALLVLQHVNVDSRFQEIRQRLHQFNGVNPANTTNCFVGQLRPYQRDGLGWLEFLQWFGMGGILADDMGLGKTIQVLATLDKHYKSIRDATNDNTADDDATDDDATDDDAKQHRPSIVIVPKSIIYNWINEAGKFTPDLRVLDYSGAERHEQRKSFADYDLIVTSYGLLRRDIEKLRLQPFTFAILDEAQAIKNPASQSAKAARLLNAQHRLALSGTPVENHLSDLWSIFEYVNPGMLGAGTKFAQLLRGNQHEKDKIEAARQTGIALRPFIMRRTKDQVLKDLPEKTEQTIVCQMEPDQRQIYDELREHYRTTLLNKIDASRTMRRTTSTFGGNAMIVLEALLRLRQAACHPALIDPDKTNVSSAKLDALMEQLDEIIDEGHKALVFSQFTSMLALVRKRLDSHNITYEYLDGQTRKREDHIERFQNDTDCPVFLISLKAGGLGLNLTAADYVYILDPWWNPAVESQAIDRVHRIGQTQHVFAYRLICQDTVEQRITELQDKKRKLADAIVGGQENLLRSLTRNDLDRLLS